MTAQKGQLIFGQFSIDFQVVPDENAITYTYMGRKISLKYLDNNLKEDFLVHIPFRAMAISAQAMNENRPDFTEDRRGRAERFCHLMGEDWQLATEAIQPSGNYKPGLFQVVYS